MIKLLHFSVAHIDLARQGRRDAESGLHLRLSAVLRLENHKSKLVF
jgi:hypothetical protein